MQKILYILEDGRFGGMPKMIADLAYGVRNKGISTSLIIGAKNSDYLISKIKPYNIPIEKVSAHILSKNVKSISLFLLFFIPDIISFIKTINKTNPDIVYCNGSQHIKGVIAGKLLGKKVIWHMHDTYQPKLIVTLFNIVRVVFGIKYFAASCERTIDFYKLPKETTLLSIPPVNTSEFVLNKREPGYKNKSEFNVVSVSNVNPDKGIDTLIRTAAKVNRKLKNVNFSIIGLIPETQNGLYDQLLNLCEELNVKNVSFLGQRNDIQVLLAESDIYLCCSNNESGPIAVFEAMAMEIPVVATDVGDLKRIFAINNSGRIQPVKDSSALAEEVISLLTDPQLRVEFGDRGRLTAEQYLDIRHSISNHINFYGKVLTKS